MKKVLFCLIGIITLIGITGCNASKDSSDVIFNSLKSEKIIDKNLEFVETVTSKNISFLINSTTYYIYKTSNNNFVAISYSSCNGDYTCDADYKVSIYDATSNEEEIIYIDEEDIGEKENYYIFDNKYSENNKYNLTNKNDYFATEKQALFKGKYYSFELAN